MINKKKIILFVTISVLLIICFSTVYASEIFTKIWDMSLRGLPGGILISENGKHERTISGGYIIKDDNLQAVETENATVTIHKGTPEEYSFELVKFIKEGSILSVRPGKEGHAHDLVLGTKKVLFTDQGGMSLWIADIDTLTPVNIQPETVNDTSQAVLTEKKLDLAKQDKDPDSYILYWVSSPLLSPNENLVAFGSNRNGFPDNTKLSLWTTDMAGITKLLVSEADDIVPIAWLNDNEICFIGEKGFLKKVDVLTNKVTTLINYKVKVNTCSPNGDYILFQKVNGGDILPEMSVLDVTRNSSTQLQLPSDYMNIGFFGWDITGEKVAFYIQDMKANIKLVITNTVDSQITVLDAPTETKFDEYIVPSWSDGKVVFSASGKLYTTNN